MRQTNYKNENFNINADTNKAEKQAKIDNLD